MLQSFLDLSRERQLAIYERAARQAIAAYRFGAPTLELVSAGNNATFKVTLEGACHLYVLRVHRPGKTTPPMLDVELRWLRALRADTPLQVPSPVPRADGALWGSVVVEGCVERFDAVLFDWIETTFVPTSEQTPAHAHELGGFVARLHQHSVRFSATPGLVRRRLDADQFFDWAALRSLHDADIATDQHQQVFDEVGDAVSAALRRLGTDAAVFGLIHTDLNANNYFWNADGVGTLDFDDMSWGYFAYDMAATLTGYAEAPGYRALRAAYLAGYREARAFSGREEAMLDTMMAARVLLSCCWIATHLDDPGIAARAPRIIAHRAGIMRHLIATVGEVGTGEP